MKVLIAEDKVQTIQSIKDYCSDNKIECQIIENFDDVLSAVMAIQYDVIILDLKKDPGEDYPGYNIFDRIWKEKFIPVIVFSSYYGNMPYKVEHPFVSYFDKTQEAEVVDCLDKYLALSKKINEIREKINDLFIQSLRFLNNKDSDEVQLQRVLIGMKNYLDEDDPNITLPADVQYLVLPKYKSLATCDIIETVPEHNKEPEFFMIMSPWCEIARAPGSLELECKKIISLECESMKNIGKDIRNHRNDGGYRNYIILPDCEKFQKKVVDVAQNALIKKDQISLDSNETDLSNHKYRKIISIASPFRERMIALCYNNRSRIGVPSLDKNSWWVNEN